MHSLGYSYYSMISCLTIRSIVTVIRSQKKSQRKNWTPKPKSQSSYSRRSSIWGKAELCSKSQKIKGTKNFNFFFNLQSNFDMNMHKEWIFQPPKKGKWNCEAKQILSPIGIDENIEALPFSPFHTLTAKPTPKFRSERESAQGNEDRGDERGAFVMVPEPRGFNAPSLHQRRPMEGKPEATTAKAERTRTTQVRWQWLDQATASG